MFIEDKDAYINYNSTPSEPTHLAIECDNLEYLKHMRDTNQKVNLIFTDIPFNSQKTKNQYSYHDALNNDIYINQLRERFSIVREIMTQDAVLFLKINHVNIFEVGGLLDEIFGKENRIIFVWKKGAGSQRSNFVKDIHEYIFLYARSKNKSKKFRKIQNSNTDFSKLEYDEINQNGVKDKNYFKWVKATATQSKYSKKNDYKYITKDGIAFYPNADKEAFEKRQKMTEEEVKRTGIAYSFKYTQESMYEREIKNELKFDEHGYIYAKQKSFEVKVANNYIDGKGMSYKTSAEFLKNILKKDAHFTYATPIPLINYLIFLSNISDGVVLDLYSGSGSTGISVLETNNKFNLNNRFILLQNNENQIFDNVTHRVLKKSIKGYVENNGKLKKGLTGKVKILRYKSNEE